MHINLKIRIFCAFFGDFFSAMIIPFMAIYFSNKIGVLYTGIILILGVLSRLFGGGVGGYSADNNGRKRVIAISEAGLVISYVLLIIGNLGEATSLGILSIVAYLCINLCLGAYEPAIEGMILDLVTLKDRKVVYAIFYWVYNLSVAIGGVVGSFLFKDYLLYVLGACVIGNIAIFLTTIFFIEETIQKNAGIEGQTKHVVHISFLSTYASVLKDKLFIWFIIASLLVISVEFHLNNYIGVRLENEIVNQNIFIFRLDGIELLGFLKSENTILILLSGMFLRRISRKSNDKMYMFIGFIIYIMGFSIMSYFNSIPLLMAAMFFATIGEVLYIPIRQSYMVELIPYDKRSSYMAVHSSIKTLSLLVASIVLMVGEYINKEVISLMICLCGMLGVIMFHFIILRIEAMKKLNLMRN